MKYIYMALGFAWIFGLGFNAAYMIPTARVIYTFEFLIIEFYRGYKTLLKLVFLQMPKHLNDYLPMKHDGVW